jgi:integrase/recombinase XerD
MLVTGVRVSELAGARWNQVFLDPQGRLCLLVHGKGGKSRVVVLPEQIWSRIVEFRTRRGLPTELDEGGSTSLIAHGGTTPYSRQGLLALVKRVAARAGLRKRVSPHWLRHSYGTLVALADVPVFEIQASMGHADITTSQRYVHWAKGLKDAGAIAVALTLFSQDSTGLRNAECITGENITHATSTPHTRMLGK